MKVFLTAVFALVLCALIPQSKADTCRDDERWVDSGYITCQLYSGPGGDYFTCFENGECESVCWPYECADAMPRHKQPAKENPSPILRTPIPVFLR